MPIITSRKIKSHEMTPSMGLCWSCGLETNNIFLCCDCWGLYRDTYERGICIEGWSLNRSKWTLPTLIKDISSVKDKCLICGYFTKNIFCDKCNVHIPVLEPRDSFLKLHSQWILQNSFWIKDDGFDNRSGDFSEGVCDCGSALAGNHLRGQSLHCRYDV